jgi:hypothetical protein
MLDFCTFGQELLLQKRFDNDDVSVKISVHGQVMVFLAAKNCCESQ